MSKFLFLSTLSLRRATGERASIKPIFGISIHALLAESDEHTNNSANANLHFYPRSPCGERPLLSSYIIVDAKISIHALLAESDNGRIRDAENLTISIHALLAESDILFVHLRVVDGSFLSTLSLRRATLRLPTWAAKVRYFYPRSPCGERQ